MPQAEFHVILRRAPHFRRGWDLGVSETTRKAAGDAIVVLAPVVTVVLMVRYWVDGHFAVDFTNYFWVAGWRTLHGLSPYSWSAADIRAWQGFPYPALTAFAFAPFALVSASAAACVFVALSLAALACALRVLGIRDRRLWAAALLWWPVISAWQAGNMGLLLVLLLALIWHFRERPVLCGMLVAVAVTAKPMLWPLAIWLIATRRWRSAAAAVGVGGVANLAAFALLGMSEISRYLHLSSQLTGVQLHRGYGVIAIALRAGVSPSAAWACLVFLTTVLVLACWLAGRRDDQARSFHLAVLIMLVASPVVWNHYLALLLVPVAISRPRAAPLWFLPLILWLCPAMDVYQWQACLAAAVTLFVVYDAGRESVAPFTVPLPRVARPDQSNARQRQPLIDLLDRLLDEGVHRGREATRRRHPRPLSQLSPPLAHDALDRAREGDAEADPLGGRAADYGGRLA